MDRLLDGPSPCREDRGGQLFHHAFFVRQLFECIASRFLVLGYRGQGEASFAKAISTLQTPTQE